MKLNYSNIFIIISILSIIFACENQDLREATINNEYDKLEYYSKDSFDKRVQNILSKYKEESFAIIDYKTCARCSGEFIDNFFNDLSIQDTFGLLFNDSSIFRSYYDDSLSLTWHFLEPKILQENSLESSVILKYRKNERNQYIRVK